MIELYTGFVGSGKSYCATKLGLASADPKLGKKTVIANYPIKPKKKLLSFFKKNKYNQPRWIYKSNEKLTVKFLVELSKKNGWLNKESQALLIFDEASIKFNSRTYYDKDRLDWINFLRQSRKLGYDVIFITQDRASIDKQIRHLCEFELVHKKLNNMFILSWLNLFRISVFAQVKYWNGINIRQSKGQLKLFIYNKRIANRYDTMKIFDEIVSSSG